MIENICSEFPDMYAMMACMGNCFAGPNAISQHFFSFRVSISSRDRGLDPVVVTDDFCFAVPTVRVAVNPGGSGRFAAFFDRAGMPFWRSRTHVGGEGGFDDWSGEPMVAG